jgi:predicted small lipoprotein YifL
MAMTTPNFPSRAARQAVLIVIGLLLITCLAACGKKGPVRPPLAALPAAPEDMRIDQQGEDFLLSWTIPALNEDASPAEDLNAFHIYRLIYNAAEGCPTCRDPDALVATITLNHPAPAVRLGKRVYWRDQAIAPGTGHAYLVVPVTVGGHEGRSAGSYRIRLEPPAAPTDVQVETSHGRVSLKWAPPPALPDGQELLGYNLYRRSVDGVFPPIALNASPLKETHLTDFAAEASGEAVYRITTVTRRGDQGLESPPSAEVTAIPAGAR